METLNLDTLPLQEIRYRKILLEIFDPEGIRSGGLLNIESQNGVHVKEDTLYASIELWGKFMNREAQDQESSENCYGVLELAGVGEFPLPENHGLEDGDQEDSLSRPEIDKLIRVVEPVFLGKMKDLMGDAGALASGIPLQLELLGARRHGAGTSENSDSSE